MTNARHSRKIKSEYNLDNAWVHARERLALLEDRQDPGTIRHLEALGVSDGWHCLEAGGGGGRTSVWGWGGAGRGVRVRASVLVAPFL